MDFLLTSLRTRMMAVTKTQEKGGAGEDSENGLTAWSTKSLLSGSPEQPYQQKVQQSHFDTSLKIEPPL